MGRGGLVAYVEAELERDIALGRLPPCGQFGSEATLARRHNVCRGTIREALRRLAARGLVLQHPGRKTRAVALDESLTLENLGLALHDARSPEARWLLEGYFSLRRQVMVELLVDCCAKASLGDLNQLSQVCFGLWDAGKWESGERCAQVEFELLRLAARVAERPGHVLLVQSLQRAFLGAAARLLPFMGGDALREWAIRAMNALSERDTRALQQELPALMRACDERLLDAFAPVRPESASPDILRAQEGLITAPTFTAPQDGGLEAHPYVESRGPDFIASAPARDDALVERPAAENQGGGYLASPAENISVREGAPCPLAESFAGQPENRAQLFPPVPEMSDAKPGAECSVLDVPGGTVGAACNDNERIDGSLGCLGRWAARLWRSCGGRALVLLIRASRPPWSAAACPGAAPSPAARCRR
ncbi:FadR/GntR family transcriptional regulator [Corallococcus sp. EGB]|uniref:FadR/GntR family transcriptional regulator n=1 Tax=Corallococcus sp. EGB TaxID=1521117 RepID=UPI001CBE6FA5|nr:GntR family transcriptional regulator [Corallococcus sp. EGB]